MKDFMLIFTGTHYSDLGLSPDEMQQRLGNWWGWQQKMKEKGILKGGNALQQGVRRIKGEGMVVTDHTSTALKEIIGGYFLVSVADLEAATEVAKDYPDYDLGGTVEVRQIQIYEH